MRRHFVTSIFEHPGRFEEGTCFFPAGTGFELTQLLQHTAEDLDIGKLGKEKGDMQTMEIIIDQS